MTNVYLIGVNNLSPNSIAGQFPTPPEAIQHTHDLFAQGATWVDIGAQATNPWAEIIPVEEEWSRYEPVLEEVMPQYPGLISIDSVRPEIHEEIAHRWPKSPHIWNDISMLNDKDALRRAIKLHHKGAVSKFILSHLETKFGQDWKRAHDEGELDKSKVVVKELLGQHTQLLLGGVPARDIILGPGIGFGKTMATNWRLLHFGELMPPGMPLEVGFSHKRMLATRIDTGEPLSKDKHYNEMQKTNDRRHHDIAEMAIEAAADRDLYLRVHEPEWYTDLIG